MGKNGRTTITNGIRPFRYLMIFIALFFIESQIPTLERLLTDLTGLAICALMFYAIYRSRKLQFDSQALYIINGKKEKAISLNEIESIKRSGVKVNGTRMWKVTYRLKHGKTRKILFLEGLFQHGSVKEFRAKTKEMHPEVVVWTHPFFHD